MKGLIWAVLAWALAAGLASAEVPLTSPRPEPNPRFLVTMGTSGSMIGSEIARHAALKPRAKPEGLALAAAPLAQQPLPAATAALRPHARPGLGGGALAVLPGGVDIAPLHPRHRPPAALRPAEVMQASLTTRSLPRLASVSPPARPGDLGQGAVIEDVAFRITPPAAATTGRKGAVCGDPGLKGQTIAPIVSKVRGCGLEDGVKITSVDGIALSQPASVDCRTARAFADWVRTGMKPAVGKLGGGVARIDIMGSYECRPRNNQKGEKISEHGRGHALDIAGVTLANGTTISVLKGWGTKQQGRILKAMHAAACGPFGTVLGPAANSFHRNHFHFDTAGYRKGSYCR